MLICIINAIYITRPVGFATDNNGTHVLAASVMSRRFVHVSSFLTTDGNNKNSHIIIFPPESGSFRSSLHRRSVRYVIVGIVSRLS